MVDISSTAARTGSPGEWTHDAATKAATETLTWALAQEVASKGVRVNAVAPGLVDTGLHAAAGSRVRGGPADRPPDPARLVGEIKQHLDQADRELHTACG